MSATAALEVTVERVCPQCGTPLEKNAWHRRVYCSPECQRKAHNKRATDRRRPYEIAPVLLLELNVEGEPATKARARRGKGGRFYTPATTREAEEQIRWLILQAGAQMEENDDLRVQISFRCETRQRRDLDNMVKLVFDACNGFAWRDDAQVVELDAKVERGSDRPGTSLEIYRVAVAARTCDRCDKSLPRWQAQTRYCSRECYDEDQRRDRSWVECSQCGKSMHRSQSKTTRATTRFCGDVCRQAFLKGRPQQPGRKWTR